MQNKLLRLYPPTSRKYAVSGLYLSHQILALGSNEHPFVYANFLSSLDGRIALEDTTQGNTYIPKHITTVSDFRLFKELQAQADCVITHGGYMRALNTGRLGNILQIRDNDLVEWRNNNGLNSQPAIIIASASLNFPMPKDIKEYGQTVYIATGKNADPDRISYWRKMGHPILIAGNDRMVQGAALIDALSVLNYKSIYLMAGPQMLDTMIRDRQLFRLYLTITHQLIGGEDFRTLLTGPKLGDEGNLILKSLFYDQHSPTGSGQFFMQFDLAH